MNNAQKPLPRTELLQALIDSVVQSLENPGAPEPLSEQTVLETIGVDSLAYVSLCIDFESRTGLRLVDGNLDRRPETIGDLFAVALELQAGG